MPAGELLDELLDEEELVRLLDDELEELQLEDEELLDEDDEEPMQPELLPQDSS